MTLHSPSARFPSTAWSCVRAAQDPDHPRFRSAMNRLIATYWKPVFCYLRVKGHSAQDAEDRTQEFFLRFLARGWLRPADPQRGRFRDFLLTLLKRFAYDQTARARVQTKFEQGFVSVHTLMQDSDRAYEPPARADPEEEFRTQWKAGLLTAVRASLRAYYQGLNKPDERRRFEIFAAFQFVDRSEDQPTQEALAARFEVSRDQVRYALKEVGQRYARFVRQELRDQVGSETDLGEMIGDLLSDG
jgi:RNA polymerase sigma-70 factor (ECF subfamily)